MLPNTLSRYIARRFLTAILASLALLALLIFMIDFIELLRQAGKQGGVPVHMMVLIALLRLPAYTEFLLAFTVLTGSISTLLMLSRKSELAVMRAGGMSAWQFLRPGLVVALGLGLFGTLLFNPLAANARGEADRVSARVFGREVNLLKADSGGTWLRQDGIDGQSVISAVAATDGGLKLTGVTVFTFTAAGAFSERIDASAGELRDGYWKLKDAWVARAGVEPEKFETYILSTYLTPERVADALGTTIAVSFWEFPALIEVAEKAKLSSSRLRLQYETLLVRPLLCLAMVLLAGTVSLRSFRSGGIQTMVVTGMFGGVGFFLIAEISRQLGVAGLAPPRLAVWLPVALLVMLTVTVLLHQEDG